MHLYVSFLLVRSSEYKVHHLANLILEKLHFRLERTGRNTFIAVFQPIEIGSSTMIGAYTYIAANNHGFSHRDIPMQDQTWTGASVRINDDVWIGTHAIVLPRVKIGKGAIVAAGSIVNKDISPYEIWGARLRNLSSSARINDTKFATTMQALPLLTLQRWTQGFRSRARRLMYRLPFSGAIKPPKGFLVSTEAWYDASQYIVLHSAHTISRTKPKTLGNDIDREFANRLEYNSPATFIAVIPDGRVAGHSVITSDDYLLADVSIEATVLPKNAANHSIFKIAFLPPIRHVPGHIAVLSAAHCENNYFHWMFNLLPRIELLRQGGFDISNVDAFVVNNSTLPFQKETLALLGVSNLLDGKANPHIQADVLIVPSLPGVMGDIPKWVCNFLRREFLKPWERSEVTHPKLIYIRRKNAKYRKIAKEDTLIGLVKDHGFEVFELESLKFQEQVSLFNSARVVVAPHGAGLTNLVFCNPGTKVIEMFSPKYVNGCYWALSNHVELDYYYLLGEGERPQEDLSHSGGGDKYEIDKTKMVSLLNTVMDKM